MALRAERGTLRPYLGTVYIRTVTIRNLNPFNLMTIFDILVGNKAVEILLLLLSRLQLGWCVERVVGQPEKWPTINQLQSSRKNSLVTISLIVTLILFLDSLPCQETTLPSHKGTHHLVGKYSMAMTARVMMITTNIDQDNKNCKQW